MITQKGYERMIELDSIRAIRVLLKLIQLSDYEGNTTITQVELAKILKLKNKANVSLAISELIENNLIKKKINGRFITYYINPEIVVTPKGYEVLQRQYDSISIDFSCLDDVEKELFEGGF